MKHHRFVALVGIAALAVFPSAASAGPPFLTDDPEPVLLHNWEVFVFSTNDDAPISETTQGPAIEYNYGFARAAYVHVAVAYASVETPQRTIVAGLGDTELGIKFQLVAERPQRPQIAFYPTAELATAKLGLGNGVTWYKLPVWLQKSVGSWTLFGGGGLALNPAPGQWNYGFGGIAVAHDLGAHLTLGAETYWQGAPDAVTRSTSYVNFGAIWKPTGHLNALLSIGRSYTGLSHTIGYGAVYLTWGPAPPAAGRGGADIACGKRNLYPNP